MAMNKEAYGWMDGRRWREDHKCGRRKELPGCGGIGRSACSGRVGGGRCVCRCATCACGLLVQSLHSASCAAHGGEWKMDRLLALFKIVVVQGGEAGAGARMHSLQDGGNAINLLDEIVLTHA